MSNKILTISIAAYNVEKYIRETLESLCIEEIIDELEIFVVDDGGKDNTFKIANEFAKKYPKSIIPIHKENGGWGSTVNYSISHASGKYFKLLDGDDYYNREGLIQLVEILRKTDVDVVYTAYRKFDNSTKKTVEWFKANKQCLRNKKIEINNNSDIDFVMHASTFRTKLLQDNNVKILEHCFYTDNEYRIKAIAYAKTAIITDIHVYQYRVGREGQSVDLSGIRKHYNDNRYVIEELLRFYHELDSDWNTYIVKSYIIGTINYHYSLLILLNQKDNIKEFDDYLRINEPEFYVSPNKTILQMRNNQFRYLKYVSKINRIRQSITNRLKMVINHR